MSILHQIEIPRHSQRYKTSVIPLPIELEDNDNQEIISKDNNVDMFAEVCMIPKSSSLFILSFNNLSYTVKPSSKMIIFRGSKLESHKILLNDISGIAREGEIMAILGASGAGKSTLLDALAGRITKHSLKGSVSLNGEDVLYKNSNLLKNISAYVMQDDLQDDLFFPMLTVKETFMYSAEFRLPRTLSKSKKKARVNALIEQLGLQDAIDTIIGDEGHRGISGGERRRVSIGIDIIHDPILLFLDEPTSGLDSTSAFKVVQVLQKIAKSGSIVITSMHQPSYRVLSILDQLIFLSRGKVAYYDSTRNLSQFFFEFGHPIPLHDNPSEFVLDLVRQLEDNDEITSIVEFNKSWEEKNNVNSTLGNYAPFEDAIVASISKGKLVSTTNKATTFANPSWVEIPIIAKRFITNSTRMPEAMIYRICTYIVTGLLLTTLFWKADDTPQGVRSKLSFFSFLVFYALYAFVEELPSFLQEKYIFIRETNYNAYRKSSYVFARCMCVLPSFIVFAFILASITFRPLGLGGGISGFFFYYSVIVASFWTGSSFVTFIAGFTSNPTSGYILIFTLMSYHILMSGFYIHRSQIPIYWLWFHYTSLVKYPYEAITGNEFNNDPRKCYVKGIQVFDHTPLESIPMAMKRKLLTTMGNVLHMRITGSTCVNTGVNILETEEATGQFSKWDCLWITIAWGFLFQILFYVCSRLSFKNKRT